MSEIAMRDWQVKALRLEAENKRLRAALEELRARGCPVDSRIARIALTEVAA